MYLDFFGKIGFHMPHVLFDYNFLQNWFSYEACFI